MTTIGDDDMTKRRMWTIIKAIIIIIMSEWVRATIKIVEIFFQSCDKKNKLQVKITILKVNFEILYELLRISTNLYEFLRTFPNFFEFFRIPTNFSEFAEIFRIFSNFYEFFWISLQIFPKKWGWKKNENESKKKSRKNDIGKWQKKSDVKKRRWKGEKKSQLGKLD